MSNYKQVYNPLSGKFDLVYDTALLVLKGTVETTADLPLTGNSHGDLYIVTNAEVANDNRLYTWNKDASSGLISDWNDIGTVSSIDWSAVNNKPSSSVVAIDSAVTFSQQEFNDVIYVGKSGNDSNDGKTPQAAVLTLGQAITLASALSPAADNIIYIACIDSGEYTEDIVIPEYIFMNAQQTKIIGNVNINDNAFLCVREIEDSSGILIEKVSGGIGTSVVKVNKLIATGSAIGGVNLAADGVLLLESEQIYVENGIAYGDISGTIGHTHLNVRDIYITGTGIAIAKAGAGEIVGRIDHILEKDSGVGNGNGIVVVGGEIILIVDDLETTVAYNVSSGATLRLNVNKFSGTETNAGTVYISKLSDIVDAITKKHTQNTDTTLDSGGANEVSAAQAKAGYTHSGVTTGNPHSVSKTDVGLGNVPNVDLTGKKYLVSEADSDLSAEIVTSGIHPTNLLLNGNFEYWYSGAATVPDGWTLFGGGASVARSTSKKLGTYALSLTRSGTDCYVYQYMNSDKGIDYWKNRNITFSCWVISSSGNTARIAITDGVSEYSSNYHTGSGAWELLTVSATINGSASDLRGRLECNNSNVAVRFDGAMMVEGSAPFIYAEHRLDNLYEQTVINFHPFIFLSGASVNQVRATSDGSNTVWHGALNIPEQLNGKDIYIDGITLYYSTGASGDYIDRVRIVRGDNAGGAVVLLDHTDDLGNGTTGNENHNIVDSTFQITHDVPIWIQADISSASADIEIYNIKIEYHLKVYA